MTRLPVLAAALCLAFAAAAADIGVRLADPGLPAFRSPFDFAPAAEAGVAVLEDLEGAVRVSSPGARTQTLSGVSSPKVLAADETGLLLALGGDSNLVAYRGAREAWKVALQGKARLGRPVGMAARNGIAWIVDRSPPRLFLYAYDGKELSSIDLKPWARSPFSVALGPAGEGFITDPLGPTVLSFSPAGTYQGALSLGGTGVTRPAGAAVDAAGRVWVSDGVTGALACLQSRGEPRSVRAGGKLLRFEDPLRMGWAKGALWVLEGKPGRVRRVEPEE